MRENLLVKSNFREKLNTHTKIHIEKKKVVVSNKKQTTRSSISNNITSPSASVLSKSIQSTNKNKQFSKDELLNDIQEH